MTGDRPDRWLVAFAYTDLPSDARIIRAASECARRGMRVTLLVPRSENRDFTLPNVEIVWLPVSNERGRTTTRGQRRFMRAVRAWAAASDRCPDVVHVHNMPDYLYWAVRRWHREGARVVLDVHDIMSELALHRFKGVKRHLASRTLRFLEKAVWNRVDHIITVHDAYRDFIVNSGIDAGRVSIVLNVPDPCACRRSMRKQPAEGTFKIVFHGTISARTGVIHAVRAMPYLLERIPNARLVIIGSGNGVQEVHDAIATLNLSSTVEFVDRYLPMPEVIEHICDADAAVVPNEVSTFTKGILPVKLLEYATLDIPVVATRLPLIEHYLGEDSAVLVDEPDPRLLAEGLFRIASDAALRKGVVAGGRRFCENHGWSFYGSVLANALLGHDDGPRTLPTRPSDPVVSET